jgi:hypothetical protein
MKTTTLQGAAPAARPARASKPARPDFVVRRRASPTVAPNRTAGAVARRMQQLRKLQERTDAAYAGAVVLQVFHAAPWLDSMEIHLSAEPCSDDEGGFYRSVVLRPESITPVPGAALTEDVFEGLAFDPDAAAAWADAQLEYEAAALFDVFRGQADYESLVLSCRRGALEPMLLELATRGRASGAQAFAALWPEEAYRVVE